MSAFSRVSTFCAIASLSAAQPAFAQTQSQLFEQLDNRDNQTFVSIEQCVRADHSVAWCQTSFDRASRAPKLYFDTAQACESKFGSCKKEGGGSMMYYTGSIFIAMPVRETYSPSQIGWQTATNNFDVSVPLYQGRVAGTAVRADGKSFRIS